MSKLNNSTVGIDGQETLQSVVNSSATSLDSSSYPDVVHYEKVIEFTNCKINSDDYKYDNMDEFYDLARKTNFNLKASKKIDYKIYQKLIELSFSSCRTGIYVGEA